MLKSKAVTERFHCHSPHQKLRLCGQICAAAETRGWVLLVTGRNESFLKYHPFIIRLQHFGYSVVTYDHRGQGLSQRLISGQPELGHVDDFQHYVDDLDMIFAEQVLPRSTDLPVYVVAHSMGGMIATQWLAMQQSCQVTLHAMVLSAPMFGIRLPLPHGLMVGYLKLYLLLMRWLKWPPTFVPSHGGYRPLPFENNPLTSDRSEFCRIQSLVEQQPELRLGGVSHGWLYSALRATQQVSHFASNITTPVLVLLATEERIIDNSKLNPPPNPEWEYQVIKGARHEILMENPAIRRFAEQSMVEFFERQTTLLSSYPSDVDKNQKKVRDKACSI